ncbi:interleukin 15, like isoform X1 [Acanthopagrus latus]|uniref:interleukin 15, like isoform X1 n=1 Tax=Acanthopagrus latus TaxID=8177 RepID=UPI00187C16C3|nr:interleukin 15, like isoform X1 [Acanthopagrus latus]XP_036942086.1 interleukin 15, like isoform X1 [Acanthopagrus latus]XP_036942096.1 interleukin 15, like isoform X1 [Acanthopagrus latus]
MLTGSLALASVHLCLACLLVLPSQSKLCSKDVFSTVHILLQSDPNSTCSGCRLYTPSIEDYKQRCPRSTMMCFANESKVLIEEWDDYRGPRLDRKLGKLAQWLKQPESECRQCEFQKEETAGKFLADLLKTLQMMNSQHCTRPFRSPERK